MYRYVYLPTGVRPVEVEATSHEYIHFHRHTSYRYTYDPTSNEPVSMYFLVTTTTITKTRHTGGCHNCSLGVLSPPQAFLTFPRLACRRVVLLTVVVVVVVLARCFVRWLVIVG